MDPKIFKAYDIRGVYPDQIDEEAVYNISRAFFAFTIKKLNLTRQPKIVLGRDGRLSSPSLVAQAKKALVESGAEVIDIGLSTTPTFYFAVYHYDFDSGLQISASHNPKEYNGIKPVIKDGQFVTKIVEGNGMERVKEILVGKRFTKLREMGSVFEKQNVLNDYVENSLKIVESSKIKELKVVADAANATGAIYLESLFKKLPCKLIKMNFDIDGNFPSHQPDPSQFETLSQLQKKVVEEKADLGIAPDGDSDRVFFVDEKGDVIPSSLITTLIAEEILRKHPGEKIGFDVRNTLNVLHSVKKNGGVPLVNRIGNPFATEIMKKEDCTFFGENSGHYFFRETKYMDDPIPVILITLSIISRENKPLSEILKPLSISFQSEQINIKTENSEKVMERLQENYKDGQINFIDGLSIDFPKWRFNVRSSNTEPFLRLNVEAFDKKLMEEKRDEIVKTAQSNS